MLDFILAHMLTKQHSLGIRMHVSMAFYGTELRPNVPRYEIILIIF